MPNNSIGLKVFTESLSESNVKKMFDQVVGIISKETGKAEKDIKNEINGMSFSEDIVNKIINELKKAEKELGNKSFKISTDLFKNILDANGDEKIISKFIENFKKQLDDLSKIKISLGDSFDSIDDKSLENLLDKLHQIEQMQSKLEGATNKGSKTRYSNNLKTLQGEYDELVKKFANVTNVLDKYNVSQEEAKKKAISLAKSQNGNFVANDKNIENLKDLVGYLQRYINLGGQLKDLRFDMGIGFSDLSKMFKGEDSDKFLGKYKNEIEELKKSISSASGFELGSGNNLESDSKVDVELLNQQKKELEETKDLLSKTQSELDEVNKKYLEQNKILEGLNDPKVIESEEYKRITEELKNAKNEANTLKGELESTKGVVSSLSDSLNAYNTDELIPKEYFENASNLIDNLKKKVEELKNSLAETTQKTEDLSSKVSTLQQDNSSLQEQLGTQKNVNSELEKQISQLEESKKKYDELIAEIKKLKNISQNANLKVEKSDEINAFIDAVKNIKRNEGSISSENFVNFDYLDKARQKLQESQKDYTKLIKAAVYYNQYLKNGGTEKIFNAEGTDYSDELIAKYKEIYKIAKETNNISQKDAVKILSTVNELIYSKTEEAQALKKTNEELQKQIQLEEKRLSVTKKAESIQQKSSSKTDKKSKKNITKEELIQDIFGDQSNKKEQQPVVSVIEQKIDQSSILSEQQALENLKQAIESVTIAITEKNKAIQAEEVQMNLSVNNEIAKLQELESKLTEIKTKLNNLFDKNHISNNSAKVDTSSINNEFELLLNKDFSTKGKKEATVQLREAYNEYKQYYDDLEKLNTVEGQKAAYNYWKAYEEAVKQDIAKSSFEKYSVDENKKGIITTDEIQNRINTAVQNIKLQQFNIEPELDENSWLTEINKTIEAIRKNIKPIDVDVNINTENVSNEEVSNLTTAIENKIKAIYQEEQQMRQSASKEVASVKAITNAVQELSELISKVPALNINAEQLQKILSNSASYEALINSQGNISSNLGTPVVALSEEWKEALEIAQHYNAELSDIVNVTKQIRTVKGEPKISYKVTDNDGRSVTVGKNGGLISSTDKISTAASDAKEQEKEYNNQLKEQEKLEKKYQLAKEKSEKNRITQEKKNFQEAQILLKNQQKTYEQIYDIKSKIAALDPNDSIESKQIDVLNQEKKLLQENYLVQKKQLDDLDGYYNKQDQLKALSDISNIGAKKVEVSESKLQEKIAKQQEQQLKEQQKQQEQSIKNQEKQQKYYESLKNKSNKNIAAEDNKKVREATKLLNEQQNTYSQIYDIKAKISGLDPNNEIDSKQIDLLNQQKKLLQENFITQKKQLDNLSDYYDKQDQSKALSNIANVGLKKIEVNTAKLQEKFNKQSSTPNLPSDKNLLRLNNLYDQQLATIKEINSLESIDADNRTIDQNKRINLLNEELLNIHKLIDEELDSEYKKTSKIQDVLDAMVSTRNKVVEQGTQSINSNQLGFSGRETDIGIAYDEAKKVNSELNRTSSLMVQISEEKKGINNFDKPFNAAQLKLGELDKKLKSGKISLDNYSTEANKVALNLSRIVAVIDDMSEPEFAKSSIVDYINSAYNTNFTTEDIKWSIPDMKGNFSGTVDIIDKTNKKITQLKMGFNALNGEVIDFGNKPKEYSSNWTKFIDELGIKFRNLGSYLLSFVGFYEIWAQIKQGVTYVKELDTALTEMRKVSNETVESLKEFQKTSFDIADSVGTTAAQIQNSTADWMRLGESIDEATESAQTSNILLNVSEFEDISTATDALVSVSQAYEDFEKIDIVDKMNNIGNNYSIATDGIASALQRSASSLTTAGNSLDEAIALVTAGNSVVQDPESVGAGLRTISLRLVGTEEAKKQLEELGEEAVTITQSKMRDVIMAATKVESNDFQGFDILDENGNYKSTYEILQGIADIYDEIVESDKEFGTNNLNLLLENLAGKNRSNIAASILQNGEMLRSVYEDSQNSAGSAEEELSKYLDSIEGKINNLTNRIQEFWYTAIDSDAVKGVVDLLTQIVQLGTAIVDTFGSIPLLVTGITAGISKFTGLKLFSGGRAKNCSIKKVNYPPRFN